MGGGKLYNEVRIAFGDEGKDRYISEWRKEWTRRIQEKGRHNISDLNEDDIIGTDTAILIGGEKIYLLGCVVNIGK